MAKYLDMDGLAYLWQRIKEILTGKVDKETGKGLSTNDYTTIEKNKLAGIEANANKYVHPNSGVTASTYKSVTVNQQGHVTSGSNPTTLAEYGIIDAAKLVHTHTSDDITSLDASKLTGMIDIAQIPHGALERLVTVTDDTARFALTTNEVQKGDTVKVVTTGFMFFVIDETKLNTEAGYEQYTASAATSVPWSGITDKPETFTPSAHTHIKSDIIDFPISMKNPNALSISVNGTVTSYDGETEKTVTIDESTLGITSISNSEIDTIING